MHTFKKIGDGFLFGCIIFFAFILIFAQSLSIPAWLQVVGRMHPLFLHFPIVLLLLSFITLWLPLKETGNYSWLDILRLVAALSAVITAIMGLLLSLQDARSGDILQLHKWSGVTVATIAFLFYTFHAFFSRKIFFGKTFTIFGTAVVIIAGHFGADLTHGEDYLLAPVENHEKKIVPLDKAIVFDDVIQPILQEKCFSCHAAASMKGGLLLSDTTGILKGGKTGPLYVTRYPDSSLIIQRIRLPLDDKHHMPPNIKAQLSPEEINLLSTWIRSGAVFNEKLIALPEQDTFRILASHYLAPSGAPLDQPVYDFSAADEKKIASLNNNYRIIEPQGLNSPALSVHFYGKDNYSSKSLEELLALKQQVIELSLARMPVKDEDLKLVLQMPNLQKLNLNYTDVTDKGIEQLNSLKNIKELSVSGTAVTQNILAKLSSFPQLVSLFVWNTKIDSAQAEKASSENKKLKIETGFKDNGKDTFALTAPMIKTPPGIFDNKTEIVITHPFKGAEIRYTLDGSVPDSATSTIYKQPINVDKNTTILARAFKAGWYGSEAAQASYIKRGYKPDSIELITMPDEKYKAPAKLLIDDDLGDISFGNGGWYGYQKTDAAYFLYFDNAVSVKSVLLNMLKNTGSFIFPPVKVEVWGGADKEHLKLLGTINPRIPEKDEPAALIQEQVSFAPSQIKCIKIIAQHLKVLPAWHAGKGQPAWVFVSEVVVN